MYVPPRFEETSRSETLALMRAYPFGLLVMTREGVPEAAHLPFLVEEEGERLFLRAHIARANPLSDALEAGGETLCIFQGPHGYISPGWTDNPKMVPTWNYQAVHVYGGAQVMRRRADCEALLARLTGTFEKDRPNPWTIDTLEESWLDRLLAATVMFEVEVTRLEAKWKLSQDKTGRMSTEILDGLKREGGDPTLVDAMRVAAKVQKEREK